MTVKQASRTRGEDVLRARLSDCDWAASPLGPPETWSVSLRTTVHLLLNAAAQIVLFWGPDLVAIYNDAYAPAIGEKHPRALGRPARENWAEMWDDLEPLLRSVLETGKTVAARDGEFYTERHGYGERVWFDLSHSAVIDDDGSVGGVLCIVSETTERVLADQRVQESATKARRRDDQLAAIYDATPIGLAMLDTQLRFVRVNERLAEWNGVPVADHIGRHVEEIVPELTDQALATLNRVLAGEPIWGAEIVGPTKGKPDPNATWRENWVPMRDEAGAIIGIAVSCEDISEERRAQRALETLNRVGAALAGEHDLERLVQMVTDGGVALTEAETGAYFHNILDESGERLHLFTLSGGDRAAYETLGQPRGTAALAPIFRNESIRSDDITRDPRYGLNAPHRGVPPGHPPVRSYLAVPVATRGGTVLGGLFFGHAEPGRFTVRHEALIATLAAQAAVAIDNAKLIGEVQAANETLERRVAERTTERDRVWRMSSDLLAIIDGHGVFQAANPAWERILGRRPADLIGRRFSNFIVPEDRDRTEARFETAQLATEHSGFENRWTTADGGHRWISWRSTIEGDLIFTSGRDVTESKAREEALREAEEALRQAQKMEAMGQLTGGVAHDFNNLLTPIMGSLDLLRRKGEGDERTARLVEGALQSAERARVLVQRLLAFARRQPLQPTAVDMPALVKGMLPLLESTLGPQIRIIIDAPDTLPPALADSNQLEMALLNLGVNARDAMPDGGTLRIGLSEDSGAACPAGCSLGPGRYIRLSIADTGAGMDAQTLARAVDPFFSTKGVGRGTGLGLSMVHGLASQLGGALNLRSTPGVGTQAELWLPVSGGAILPAEADPAAALARGSGIALLVDDEPMVRMTVAEMLEALGYRVHEADGASDAMRLVEEGLAPDLLVSDHLMPGMTGTDLARALRPRFPAMRVLIVSGYAELETLSSDLAHLSKPFGQDDLARALGV